MEKGTTAVKSNALMMKCYYPGCWGEEETHGECDAVCICYGSRDHRGCHDFLIREKTRSDDISSPDHYKAGAIEAIDVIEAFGLNYRLSNVVKYVLRHERKGNPLKDLKKAQFYLNREIQKREEKGEK